MKRLVVSILLVPGILVCFLANGQSKQHWNKYYVSKSINTAALNKKNLFRNQNKAAALENNIADVYLYKNGVLIKPPSKDTSRNFFTAGCICFKFDDTLLLNSGLGRVAGVGVGLKIYKDKFTGSLHANAVDSSGYKLKKSDKTYTRDITVQAESQSLKLLKHPSFAADEIVVGEYMATYKNFYKKTKSGDELRKYTVRLIFKCKITGMDSMKESTTGGSSK